MSKRLSNVAVAACLAAAGWLFTGSSGYAADASPEGSAPSTLLTLSPLFGWDRNERIGRDARGQPVTLRDTAPIYGLFGMAARSGFVLTGYIFYSEVNRSDVWGNLAYLNWSGDRRERFTWNVGAGHLYHKIESAHADIRVTVPMVKTGPMINIPEWNLSLNPYVGYAWERVETPRAEVKNDSTLYGINIGWRWRMMGATLRYYYQDSREDRDNYHTLRVRANTMINRNWGVSLRMDYMEKFNNENTSIQFGPIYVFGNPPAPSR